MPDKVALFYNPVAGGGRFKYKLDQVAAQVQDYGLQLVLWRISSNREIRQQMKQITPREYHTIVAAGGDGTVNGVIDAMMGAEIHIPLAIIPEGTSNDLARYLNLPSTVPECCRVLAGDNITPIDLGLINGRDYFVNVASAGFIVDSVHQVDYRAKNALGRMAYYLKAMEKLPQIRPMQLECSVDGQNHQMEILLFLLLNSGTVGGFQGLLPGQCASDGMLDFMAIKPAPLPRLARLLFNFQRGGLVEDDSIFYSRGQEFSINVQPEAKTDLDGEKGPPLPWKIEICPAAVQIRTG